MPRLRIRFSLFKACLAVSAQPGVMAAGAPQAAANGASQPGGTTGTVGASQPGGSPWQGSVFLRRTLPQHQDRLRRENPQLHLVTTAREAMDTECALQNYLPLPVEAFVDFDILRALGSIGGAGQPAETSVEGLH